MRLLVTPFRLILAAPEKVDFPLDQPFSRPIAYAYAYALRITHELRFVMPRTSRLGVSGMEKLWQGVLQRRTAWVAVLLLLISALCVIGSLSWPSHPASLHSGISPKLDAMGRHSGSVEEANLDEVQPRRAVVLIRDLGGYLVDCACSGEEVGGLSRIPSVIPRTISRSYLFTGDLFSEAKDRSLTGDALELFKNQMVLSATGHIQALRELGRVWWIPSPEEMTFLRSAGFPVHLTDSFRLDSHEGRFEGIPYSFSDSTIRLWHIPIPLVGESLRRARAVSVVALWCAPEVTDFPRYSKQLGQAFRLSALSPRAMNDLRELLLELDGAPAVGTWGVRITGSLPVDSRIAGVVDGLLVAGAHAIPNQARLSEVLDRKKFSEQWESCSTCHASAFENWTRSRHFLAYDTLLGTGRFRDVRCLSCHVQEFDVTEGRARVAYRHAGVTCMSCHSRMNDHAGRSGVCTTCHTEITDPKGNYRAHVNGHCGGAIDSGGQPCARTSGTREGK